MDKPPLGITPRKFWLEKRAQEILSAIERYVNSPLDIPIPKEWVEELETIYKELTKK